MLKQMIGKSLFILLLVFSSTLIANDYPTHESVHYVLDCFKKIGRTSFDDLQTCSCRIDSIASDVPFEVYSRAVTYERNRRMTGKKGGIFRDNEAGKAFYQQLTTAEEKAGKQCKKVVHIVAPTDLTKDPRYLDIEEIKQ